MKKILIFLVALGVLFSINIFPKANATTETSRAGIVETAGANLNVRSDSSTSSVIIGKVKNNAYLTIINEKGSFFYVEYLENTYGYVHKDYVRILSNNVKKVNTGDGSNLNVRKGPSTAYQQFEKIKHNDYVVILSNSGSFSKVLFEGNKVGYVSNDYLVSVYTYSAVKLSVESYKQYDSRWAYLTLGTKGKTIKEIGCLTTCMAMSESYRTGSTKTPAAIRTIFSYTKDGSLYWPSNYTTSTSSNYLSTIYTKLKNNQPVLIGLKTANGGQHWVLVVGFTGGNTLTTSNFLIHDPASSKTRLSEVMTNYPSFYKIAYYK
ncbi:MAG: SH3 domain-containing protein [Roseburia sp.]|nr:SH3 domain-containing protein [Anaeroplasma bactoclasticum]MCM1195698.1 SH3 domain-containing protein [Roseburia sp.]MCM1556364.1 SH3 domain-containing protein [Anaeroplasma bactoclasticum]